MFDSSPPCRRGLSVLARAVSRRAPGSWTTPGLTKASRLRSRQCGLPVTSTRSAPELRFSKLNSRPVDASVYPSPGTSRHPAQDSRSRWFATPFSWGSFIPDCTPVYPDHCACSRATLPVFFESMFSSSRPSLREFSTGCSQGARPPVVFECAAGLRVVSGCAAGARFGRFRELQSRDRKGSRFRHRLLTSLHRNASSSCRLDTTRLCRGIFPGQGCCVRRPRPAARTPVAFNSR